MALPKFIITMDGVFRLGMVNQHKELLKPGDQCIGGGYWRQVSLTFDKWVKKQSELPFMPKKHKKRK